MAQNTLRGNLSAANVPLLSELMGRSIILPQHDQNYDKAVLASSTDADKDRGIPQVFYLHNYLPTGQGFQAVGYLKKCAEVVGATDFDQVMPIRNTDDNNFLFSPASGKNYVYRANAAAWKSVSPFPPGTVYGKTNISYAYINGETYICIQGQGVYKYDATTETLTPVTFAGLTMTAIKGILASSGYMLAYDDLYMYWSSAVDPLDFVPSLATGAGSGAPSDIKGFIVTALPISGGFIVYATGNAVGAQFSGNIRFPFVFKEVVGSGGVNSAEVVTYSANLAEHYAVTSNGLQKLDRVTATVIQAEVTDFIVAQRFEDFDTTLNQFVVSDLSSQLKYKLTLASNRFLVLSYGVSTVFSHALVLDTALKRWGKLRFQHVDCFEYTWPNLFGVRTYAQLSPQTYADLQGTAYKDLSTQQQITPKPKTSVAFLKEDGSVYTLDMSFTATVTDAVIVIGKYQFNRERLFTLQHVELENVELGDVISCYALPSLDGKSFQAAVPLYATAVTGKVRRFNARTTGINQSVLVKGKTNLTSIIISYTRHGGR